MFVLSFILKVIFFESWFSAIAVPLVVGIFWFPFTVGMLILLNYSFHELYDEIIKIFIDENSQNVDSESIAVFNTKKSSSLDLDDGLNADEIFSVGAAGVDKKKNNSSNMNFKKNLQDAPNLDKDESKEKITSKDFDFETKDLAKAVSTMISKNE